MNTQILNIVFVIIVVIISLQQGTLL